MTTCRLTGSPSVRRCLGWLCDITLAVACAALASWLIVSLTGCTTTRLPDGTTVKTTMTATTVTPGRVETNADRAIDRIAESPEKAMEMWQRSGQQLEK